MPARLVEIGPGEVRTVCQGCGRVIAPRHFYCDACKPTKGQHCSQCGKPSKVAVCGECKVAPPGVLSEDRREIAEQMWAEGAGAKEIAARLGIRTKHPGTMISKARRRGWNLPYRRPDMVQHGRKIAKRYLSKGSATSRMRRIPNVQGRDATRAAVERMWAEGFTGREICENMGWSLANSGSAITKARNRGWNLPYRNPGVVEDARAKMRVLNT